MEKGISQRKEMNGTEPYRRKGRVVDVIAKLEKLMSAGLACVLLFLGFLAVPGQGQDLPSELAFARKLYDDGLYLLAAEQYRDFAQKNPTSPQAAQARFMVGESFFAQGDLVQAEEAYREFLAEHPQSQVASQAWFRLGTCLSQADHFSAAAAAFSRSRQMEPEGPWASAAQFGMADALCKAGQEGRALEEFDFFLKRYPQSPQCHEAHMARGEILLALGQLNQARAAYQAAAQQAISSEGLARARFREGQILALQEDEGGAIDLLSFLVEQEPTSMYADSALSLLGDLHLERGEYLEAAKAFGTLASRLGTDELAERAGFREAESLRLAADHGGAISSYRRWLARYPQCQMAPEAKLGLAQSLRALGDLDSAAAVLEELARRAGEEEWGPRAWKKLGDTHCERGKPSRALEAYREFLRRYPQSPQADSLHFRTAQILEVDLNRPRAALRTYQTLFFLYPHSRFADDADFAAARCHEASGEYGQALQAYLVFVQEHPLSSLYPLAQERIAYLSAYRVRDESAALEALVGIHDHLASGSLKVPEMDLRLGEIYFRYLKDFSKAIMVLERYIQKHPDSPLADQALFQLAECYGARAEMLRIEGNPEGAAQAQSAATEACRRLLRDHPQSQWADRCALQVIADLLRESDSQSGDSWLDQLDLYGSFLNTYAESGRRGYAYLQIGRAYLGLAAQDPSSLARADSVFAIILDLHPHSPWADTAAFQRIGIAQRRGDEVAVLELCQQFLGAFPESGLQSQVLFAKAQIHAHRLEHRLAAESFRSAAEDFPYHPLSEEARIRWAESLWAMGDAQSSRRVLEEFGELYPESPLRIRAVILLAQDLAERGRHHEAQSLLSSLEETISQDALDDGLQLALGDLYLKTGSLQRALDSYGALVGRFPTSNLAVTALERMADAHFSSQNFSEGQEYYERALDETSDDGRKPYLESRRIICLYRLGRLQEAAEARKEFEKANASQLDLMSQLLLEEGQAQAVQGEKEAARKSFQTVLHRYKDSPYAAEAEYRLGLLSLQSGQFSEALDRFHTVVESHPHSPWKDKALFKMGSALFGLERYDQAAECYERVVGGNVEADLAVDALFNAGICRSKMNDWDGAEAAYERLLRDFPEHQERQKWRLRLGFAYLQAEKPAQALRTFEQIEAGEDTELGAEVQFWLGECYFHLGEYEKAAQEYLRVAYLYPQKDPWAATAEYNAAMSYEKLGREEEARTIYRKLVASRGHGDQWGDMAQERLDKLVD